jgi:hypothetical protein
MRDFVAGYCDDRFSQNWHLGPDQSLLLRSGERTLPRQLQIWTPAGNNQLVQLPHGCSLFIYRAPAVLPAKPHAEDKGIRLVHPPDAPRNCLSVVFRVAASGCAYCPGHGRRHRAAVSAAFGRFPLGCRRAAARRKPFTPNSLPVKPAPRNGRRILHNRYESVAGVQFDAGLMATTDVDLLWDARATLKLGLLDDAVAEAGVLAILQKVDRSFEPVRKGDFRAVNKSGFYVDLVKQAPNPPWKSGEPERIAAADLKPSWLPNIKWLLASEKFRSVVLGQDGLPAPMVCPDPRAFAVYKEWLSEQPDRDPGKVTRDRQQAAATIALVREKFPHLALDENAERMFPAAVRRLSCGSEFGL